MKRISLFMVILTLGRFMIAFSPDARAGYEGSDNTFYGANAGVSTTGSWDTFIGANAGYSNTTGLYNTFVGYGSGYNNTTGNYNTFLGLGAGFHNTTGGQNTLLGYYAGMNNTTGYYNTFIGYDAGANNTTGSPNSFLGHNAGPQNTTGYLNTFLGHSAGYSNTSGYINTFIGDSAGYSNTTSSNNVFLGYAAGYHNTTGVDNTFIGRSAGASNTTGYYNTFLGFFAGFSNSTGFGNVFLGNQAGYNETGSNKLYIDNSNTSTPLIYGEFDNHIVTINGNLEVVAPNNGLIYLSNVTTDNTTKVSRMVLNHYSNAEEPVYLFGAASTATNNFVAFGGGNTVGNAATQLDFFTAPNPTTLVGYPRLTIIGNGYVGIGIQDPMYPLEMAGGAYSNVGSWIDGSSREYKDDIERLTSEEAFDALEGLDPVKYAYKKDRTEKRVGFIAEDVPDLVATKDRKGLSSMDIVAVLTKVVQEQQGLIKGLEQRLHALEGKEKTGK